MRCRGRLADVAGQIQAEQLVQVRERLEPGTRRHGFVPFERAQRSQPGRGVQVVIERRGDRVGIPRRHDRARRARPARHTLPPPAQRLVRRLQRVPAEVHLLPVAMLEESEPQRQRIQPARGQVGQQHHVPGGLGHLAPLEQQVLPVHPLPDHVVPGDRVGLGPLVLVVREAQIDAAGMDVDVLAEVVQRHRRALGVPAGEAGAPRGRPGELGPPGRGFP